MIKMIFILYKSHLSYFTVIARININIEIERQYCSLHAFVVYNSIRKLQHIYLHVIISQSPKPCVCPSTGGQAAHEEERHP